MEIEILPNCIQHLITELNNYFESDKKTLEGFLPIYEKMTIQGNLPEVPFSKEKYTRNRIYKNDNFEVLLIGWDEGNGTGVHDHALNGCLLKVIQGSLRETRYSEDNVQVSNFKEGSTSYIHNSIGTHKLENSSEGQTVSLHIYAPPDYVCRYTTDT